jgi:hypothetical protein
LIRLRGDLQEWRNNPVGIWGESPQNSRINRYLLKISASRTGLHDLHFILFYGVILGQARAAMKDEHRVRDDPQRQESLLVRLPGADLTVMNLPSRDENKPAAGHASIALYEFEGKIATLLGRGSLVREGDGLENHWRPAPREFKSPPRRF